MRLTSIQYVFNIYAKIVIPCCHLGASMVSHIHKGSDGSSIAIPILANVIEPEIQQYLYRIIVSWCLAL